MTVVRTLSPATDDMLRRLAAVGSEQCANLSPLVPVSAFRGYASRVPRSDSQPGDPGPSTLSHSRKARSKFFEAVRSGRDKPVGDVESLHKLFDSTRVAAPRHDRRSARDEPAGPRRAADTQQQWGMRQGGPSRASEARPVRYHKSQPVELSLDPYSTSRRLQRYMEAHPSPMSSEQLDTATAIVVNAPKAAASAPTWNMLFGLLAREGRMNQAWTLYNKMKKRGIAPTSRTFTILMDGFAESTGERGLPDEPASELTISRVEGLFQHSERHIRSMLPKQTDLEEDGLVLSGQAAKDRRESVSAPVSEEVSLAPRHAYMKFHMRRGDLLSSASKILAVWQTFPRAGPLRPDAATYSLLLRALSRIPRPATGDIDDEAGAILRASKLVLADALQMLDRPSRGPKTQDSKSEKNNTRTFDELLVQNGLLALLRAGKEGRILATDVFAHYIGLESAPFPLESSFAQGPEGEIDTKTSFESLIQTIPPARNGASFATSFLEVLLTRQNASEAAGFARRIAASPAPGSARPQSRHRRQSDVRERPRASPRLVLRCLSEAIPTEPQLIQPIIEEFKRNVVLAQERPEAVPDLNDLFLEALNAVLRLEPSQRWRYASVIFTCYTRQTDLKRVGAVDFMESIEPSVAPGPQGLSLLLKIALSVDMASRKQERLALAARSTPDLPVIVQAWRECKRYTPDGTRVASGAGGEAATGVAPRARMPRDKADFWLRELDRVARATQNAAEAATEEIERRRRSRQRETIAQQPIRQ